jgi:hypothetical protein
MSIAANRYFKKCSEKWTKTYLDSIESTENPTAEFLIKKKQKIITFYRIVFPSLISKYFNPKTGGCISAQEEKNSKFVCLFKDCINDKIFATRSTLTRHLISYHYEEIPGGGMFLLDVPGSHNRFVCSKCKLKIDNEMDFVKHLKLCSGPMYIKDEKADLTQIQEQVNDRERTTPTYSLLAIKYNEEWHEARRSSTPKLEPEEIVGTQLSRSMSEFSITNSQKYIEISESSSDDGQAMTNSLKRERSVSCLAAVSKSKLSRTKSMNKSELKEYFKESCYESDKENENHFKNFF